MITIISSTNRSGSECLKFSERFLEMFKERVGEEVQLLNLEELPGDMLHPDMYGKEGQHPRIVELQDQYLTPVSRWFFVVPEYNGGFPGVLKLFLDACSVRNYNATFKSKQAALVGVASGRAGNLRGMEHLTGVLNYLGVTIMPKKLPISQIEKLMDDSGTITDTLTLETMQQQVDDFLAFCGAQVESL